MQKQIQEISAELPTLYAELGVLQQGLPLESPLSLLQPLPIDIEELRTLLDALREKEEVELEIMDIRGRGPEKLTEALNFYDDILLTTQTFDAPSILSGTLGECSLR